jgi:polysaccharide pyruvyl transferase CsaB
MSRPFRTRKRECGGDGRVPKPVLISAFIGSENLGDEAIFRAVIDNLGIDKSCITALSNNEAKTRALGVDTVPAKNPVRVLSAIRNCDVLMLGGGGIIQDQSSILNFLYFYLQLAAAKFYRKRSLLCFVGVGPLRSPISRFLLRTIASNVSFAVVRDESSKEILLRYMKQPDAVLAAHDPVLNFAFDPATLPPSRYGTKKPYIIVSVRRWFFTRSLLPVTISRRLGRTALFSSKYTDFVSKLADNLDRFLENHPDITPIFVSLYDSEDYEVLEDLMGAMRNPDRVILAKRGISEIEYLSMARQSLFVLGMRLHALILGAAVDKPFIALRYSTKVSEFAEQFGLTENSILVEEYDSATLDRSLERMVEQAPQLESKMREKLAVYRRENAAAFERLQRAAQVPGMS